MSYLLALTLFCIGDSSDMLMSDDLASKLKSEKLWTDFELQKTLNTYLTAAKKNPTDKVIAVLIEHIDYDIYSYGGIREKMIALEKQYAVVGLLSEIGLPSVPALVDSLKTTDPEDKKNDGERKQWFAIICIRNIYDQGGFGVQLARQRIELEMKKANPKEKKYLERALKHCYLEVKE